MIVRRTRLARVAGPFRVTGRPSVRVVSWVAGAILWAGVATSAVAAELRGNQGPIISDGAPVQRVVVTVNKSRTFNVERPFARAIVGSVDFAEVMPLSDRAIYVQGKKVGTTNVSLFDGGARLIGVLDLEIVLDSSSLQQQIRASTGNQTLRVTSVQGQIVVGGVASDAVTADRAMQVAKSVAGSTNVVNAMQIAPSQQVMLEVRFLEATREAGRELGVNWQANVGRRQIVNTGRGLATVSGVASGTTTAASNAIPIPILSTVGTLVGTGVGGPFGSVLANVLQNGNTSIDVLVTALEEKGLVRRLAEPNLIALSGDEARFLAGGEFPVPIATATATGFPTITVEWKVFGVRLKFKPTVLSRGVINLRVEPEVSELDFANAILVGGTQVPALTKRDAVTTVELRDGQSFAIAGLLSSQNTAQIAQVPWLGTVPVLGALFRSSAYQQKETDLVIIVTPRLIGPAVPGQKLESPLASRLPANDVDLFLNGQPEVKKRYQDFVTTGGALKGPYGHMIEVEQGPSRPVGKK